MKILEVKRHLNKPDQSYLCDLFYRGSGLVVLKYVSDRPGCVGDILFEPWTTTYAIYKAGEGYVLWKMVDPQGTLKGYLWTCGLTGTGASSSWIGTSWRHAF
jgi:hypothetical protein